MTTRYRRKIMQESMLSFRMRQWRRTWGWLLASFLGLVAFVAVVLAITA